MWQVQDKDNTTNGVADACKLAPSHHLRVFVQHSGNVFKKCSNSNPNTHQLTKSAQPLGIENPSFEVFHLSIHKKKSPFGVALTVL